MFRVRFKETASQAQARIIEQTEKKLAAVLRRHKLVLTGQDAQGFACYVRLPRRKVRMIAKKPGRRSAGKPTARQMQCEGVWAMPKRLRRIWYGSGRRCLDSAAMFLADGRGYCDHHGRKQLGQDAHLAAQDAASRSEVS